MVGSGDGRDGHVTRRRNRVHLCLARGIPPGKDMIIVGEAGDRIP